MDREDNEQETESDINPFNIRPQNSRLAQKEPENNISIPIDHAKPKVQVDPNSLFYDMTGDKYLVIFNHYEYDRLASAYRNKVPSKRTGTEKDVEALKETFTKLGFKIDDYHDESRETVWNILLQMRKTDMSSVSCLCIAILTHGFEKDALAAYDNLYDLKDVIKLFENHPSLAGKPKLFFIQACRGTNMDDGNMIGIDGDDDNYFVAPSHADFLIVRSTVDDYLSYRDDRGSWMIQELCKMIQKYHEEDILHIITRMQQRVAYGYATYSKKNKNLCNKRQMPETTFTLTKFLKF